ncbi:MULTISPECIES: hypothetical protein [Planktothrix]|jgi:hypothetical protein|uniref:hypothetical protein n=1 Tax=Planktothrix TaxID=54304 RepID=UPI0003FEA316|nr:MULTISPECIES: hypothetical protein [Planktothrix]
MLRQKKPDQKLIAQYNHMGEYRQVAVKIIDDRGIERKFEDYSINLRDSVSGSMLESVKIFNFKRI